MHTLTSVIFSDATATALALPSGMRIEPCTQIDVGLSRCFQYGVGARRDASLAASTVSTDLDADAVDEEESDEDEDAVKEAGCGVEEADRDDGGACNE